MKILNSALGKSLGESLKRRALYRADAPTAISIEDLSEIAFAVNLQHGPEVDPLHDDKLIPKCIIIREPIANRPFNLDPYRLEVAPSDALSYRGGNRLAIVSGDSKLQHSITSSFTRVVMESNFPEGIKSESLLKKISFHALDELCANLNSTWVDSSERQLAVDRIANCLNQVASVHKTLTQSSARDWNANWFEHASRGLENLNNILLGLQSGSKTSLTLSSALASWTYGAFGFPNPKNNLELLPDSVSFGREYQKALDLWWSDEEQIQKTLGYLRVHKDTSGDVHPLEGLIWSNFDSTSLSSDSVPLAYLSMSELSIEDARAFSDLTEDQFFAPLPKDAASGKVSVSSEEGKNLSIAIGSSVVYFADVFVDESESFRSEPITVEVPSVAPISKSDFDSSNVTLIAESPNLNWVGLASLGAAGGSVLFHGYFEFEGSPSLSNSVLKPTTIKALVPKVDSLTAYVDFRATAKLALVPPTHSGMAVWKFKRASTFKPVDQVQPPMGSFDPIEFDVEIDAEASTLAVFVWGSNVKIEAEPMVNALGRANWFVKTFSLGSDVLISSGEQRYLLRNSEKKGVEQSPVLAAIRKVPLTSESLDDENASALRGVLERILVDNIDRELSIEANHHYSMSAGSRNNLIGTEGVGGLVALGNISAEFASASNFKVPDQIINSVEAANFRSAFLELDIEQSLYGRSGLNERADIPSRTSWRRLWESGRDRLDAYLEAYSALVEKSRTLNNPDAVFWATYPFSFSVWDLEQTGLCKAVMLSPIHPLRLAWLSAVESTLYSASDAADLAGTIEGWNFPAVGPATTSSGSFIAVPSDNGAGQLFLGWSVMVSSSIDEPMSISAPLRAGGLRTPGIAAGGMNSSSTTAALNAYRRINPHVSTLTVDLAAVQPAGRLGEIDDAIMQVSQAWASSQSEKLIGGFRVFDSLNRLGDPPIGRIQEQAGGNVQTPMVWSRYQHSFQNKVRCNIRLLQDSGVKIAIRSKTDRTTNLGIVGGIPLRRFEAFGSPQVDVRFGESSPSLDIGASEPSAFRRALASAERADLRPIIQSQLHNSVLVDDSAEWTVSGEAMVSPSNLATMLNVENNGNQMLWEWRPPFLDAGDSHRLERRPFLAVAKIPNSFKSQLASMMSKALGRDVDSKLVNSILSKLGSRGVGLSSLLAMGGTHAAGALGFYLMLAILEEVKSEGKQYFVLPIDACEPFLKALANVQKSDVDFTKRADLLLLTLDDQGMSLTPVEIKLYGLTKENPTSLLPAPGSGLLKEALQQVTATQNLLSKVQSRYLELHNEGKPQSADFTLWLNGLAALTEAAMKMAPTLNHDELKLRNRFEKLISGDLSIRLGKPLVAFFGHDAYTAAGAPHAFYLGSSNPMEKFEYGLSVANVASCFNASDESKIATGVLEGWSKLVDWSTGLQDEAMPFHGGGLKSNDSNESTPSAGALGYSPEGGGPVVPEVVVPSSPVSDGSTIEGLSIVDHGVEIKIGDLLGSLQKTDALFWPANTDLNQMNVGVVGDLGTGKTQLLKSMVSQLRSVANEKQPKGLSFLIFDYKDDYTDQAFVRRTNALVLKPENIPLNVFKISGEYTKQKAAKRAHAFCDVLSKIYANVGPIQTTQLALAITSLFEINQGKAPTLSAVLARYQDIVGRVDSVVAILSKFTMQEIFTEDDSLLCDFHDLIDDRVLVVSLSDFAADRATQNAIVVLFLDLYYEYMLESTKWPFEGESPQLRRLNSFLLVDEATNIMEYEFDVLSRLLLQGRQFGFGVILASQYLSHFKTKGTNYGEPLLTWIIHKVPSVKVSELIALGIPQADESAAKSIANLPIHQAFYSSLNVKGAIVRGLPFFELDLG